MSDDQLSWENLLKSGADDDGAKATAAQPSVATAQPSSVDENAGHSDAERSAEPASESIQALKAASREPRSRQKAKRNEVESFAGLDWGPLDLSSRPPMESRGASKSTRANGSTSAFAPEPAFDPVVTRSELTKAELVRRDGAGMEIKKTDISRTEVSRKVADPNASPGVREAEAPAMKTTTVTDAKVTQIALSGAPSPSTTVTRVKVSSTTLTSAPNARSVADTLGLKMTNGLSSQSAARDLEELDAETDEEGLTKPKGEPQIISVYELNKSIRSILEGRFPLIWVKGEISNFKAHTSGHWYFSLKDSKAQISGVMFKGFNQQIKFRPSDGMEVIVRGRVTVYEPRGNYQIFCEMMEPVGAGALQKAFEQLKSKLQSEGLFDAARKRQLPALPRHIAIVTSPTGAAIRDMLNVLGRRFKGAKITVVPTKVQGEQAAPEIVTAIGLANRLPDVDVMIVGRGGGSIEDMWCFNDERVARAIAAARVPVISAVGHEIDFTIADFVADLRAPTPSAAAELVVKNAADLQARIEILRRSLRLAQSRQLQAFRQRSASLTKRLVVVDPQRRIQTCMQRLDELGQRLEASSLRAIAKLRMHVMLLREKLGHPERRIETEREKLSGLEQRLATGLRTLHARKRGELEKQMALLDSLSPLRVVERGYSLVTLDNGVVNNVSQVKEGDVVCIQFAHGRASAAITRIENRKGVRDDRE